MEIQHKKEALKQELRSKRKNSEIVIEEEDNFIARLIVKVWLENNHIDFYKK